MGSLKGFLQQPCGFPLHQIDRGFMAGPDLEGESPLPDQHIQSTDGFRACSKGRGVLFRKGKQIGVVEENDFLTTLMREVEKL